MELIRVGLLGVGRHMQRNLLPNLVGSGKYVVVAACDRNLETLEELARRFPGVQLFDSANGLLDHSEELGMEAILIALDPLSHPLWMRRALERGLHVFVEKPAALTRQDLDEAIEIAEKRKLVTMVGAM